MYVQSTAAVCLPWQHVGVQVVAPLLPGGHLRAGFLLAADPATQRTTLERWALLV